MNEELLSLLKKWISWSGGHSTGILKKELYKESIDIVKKIEQLETENERRIRNTNRDSQMERC